MASQEELKGMKPCLASQVIYMSIFHMGFIIVQILWPEKEIGQMVFFSDQ